MRKSKRIIVRTLAFARKEFKLSMRYKWTYVSRVIILPLLHIIPFLILYGGFQTLTTPSPDDILINPKLFLGSIIVSVFVLGLSSVRIRFANEKFWMTMEGTLIAPASKYYLLSGVIIELGIQAAITSVMFMVITFILYPTAIINIILVSGIIFLILIAGSGLSLLNGTFVLINENLAQIFDFAQYFLVFFSTHTILYEYWPKELLWFVNVNPLYHFVNLTRNLWLGVQGVENLWSFLYIIVFTVICVMIGVWSFSKLTLRYGIRGY